MLEKPTHEQLVDWRESRTTKYLLNEIDNTILELQERWAAGNFTGETADSTVQLNAKYLGVVQGLLEIKDFIENIVGELDED